MSEATRRTFITTSGIGVAAAGVAAMRSTTSAAAVPTSDGGLPDVAAVDGMIVAVVHDVRAGAVSLMVGEKEIVLQDRDLVSRLLQASAR